MNKMALLILSGIACLGCSSESSAYSRTKQPISQTKVVLGTTAIGAAVWGLTKLLAANPPDKVTVVSGGCGIFTASSACLNPMSDSGGTIIASVVALIAAGISWKCLSSYTAQSYADAAQAIMSGEKCSQPEVLEFVQQSSGDAQVLSDALVNYFAAQKNELVKSVNALEELANQLLLANYYFEVAKKGSNCADADLMVGFQEIIASHLTVIRAASLQLKSDPDFGRQSNAALQELGVSAQFETASAIRQAGYASHTNYNYNLN